MEDREIQSGTLRCDLLVIGSGAPGLAAAVTAAHLGLDVVVAEKTEVVGGTSAWSGGWLWIPRNPLALAAGQDEDPAVVRGYLRRELGPSYDEAVIETFLEQGPKMVSFFDKETSLQFINGTVLPDFHGKVEGAALGGRAVCAAPYDGRNLGRDIALLRPPLDLVSPFGMGIASGADMAHFFNALRRWPSFLHVARRVSRHMLDIVLHGRGMQLVNGNALVARLLRSALDLGVRVMTSAPARDLIVEDGAVRGARVDAPTGTVEIRAERGVVLAAGGFPHDERRRAELFPHAPTGREHWSAAPKTNTGDGLRLGESAGGTVRRDLKAAGGWIPVSLVPRADGTFGHHPHLVERAKPGLIMVRADGNRFCDEADSYHDVMLALFAATPPGEKVEAWLVCDHRFLRRYGLGRVRPRPFSVRPWLRNGYMNKGRTLAELAAACGIAPDGLERTVERFNGFARTGQDADFGRGETPFNRGMGEAGHAPNPSLGALETAPFYAVKVVPGSLSTFAGLRTDERARVLDAELKPVRGLYAVGNDMSSIAGGNYPSGGFTLGPGMTFGYVAAHDAAGVPLDNNRST